MAAKKFLRLVAGALVEVLGIQTSAGAGNAGDIPSLDDTGRLDGSMMPVGIGADTLTVTTSEALADGDWVNLYNLAGAARARKADATVAGKGADGFVLASVASGGAATIYASGGNTHVTGQTPGEIFLAKTAGQGTSDPTTGFAAGNVSQRIGVAVSATTVSFKPRAPVTLA